MKQLDHETSKSLECPGYSNGWGNFDQDALGGVDVYLEFSCFIDRGVEEGKQALSSSVSADASKTAQETHLMCNIRSSIANISSHLSHDSNMLIAVQE